MKLRLLCAFTALSIALSYIPVFADGETEQSDSSADTAIQSSEDITTDAAVSENTEPVTDEPAQPVQAVGEYSDVPQSHWAYSAIKTLAENQVINGMGDGTFNPDGKVTREQFVKLIVGAYKYGGETDAVLMPPDTSPQSWSYTYIRSAIIRKIINPETFVDGLFNPSEPVTRATAVQWLANSLNATAEKACPFPDVRDDATKAAAALTAERGLVGGYDDFTFKPDRTLSRAEAAIIIARLTGISPLVPYPEITGTYYDISLSTLDNRNSWAVDGANIVAYKEGKQISYCTSDSDGQAHLFLTEGEYNLIISHKDYESTSLPITVSGNDSLITLNLVPLKTSEFRNVYPKMSEDEKNKLISALNDDSLRLTIPDEYDYKTGYNTVLTSILYAAPFISSVGYSADTNSATSASKTVAVKSSAEKVDGYILRHYGLSPQHNTRIDDLLLSYSDGYWYYDQKFTSTNAVSNLVVEALYTADNTFFYLKYSLGESPDTKFAVLYRTKMNTFQIVWTSNTQMSDDALKAYVAEAKEKFPSCIVNTAEKATANLKTLDPTNGYPVDNVHITIYSPSLENVGEGTTDANGNISTTLPQGTYCVYAQHRDYAPSWSCFTISGETSADITLNSKQ